MPAFGLETLLQPVPFQRSASVWLLLPTLQISFAASARTAVNENPNPLGPELSPAICTHLVPFHCKMSVCKLPTFVLIKSPTAQTLFVASAVTPNRRFCFVLGFGLVTTLHAEPFQCSVSVSGTELQPV